MRRLLLAGLSFLAAVALSLQAEEAITTIKEGSPSEYVVKKGDTLWAIADRFLNQPWKWPSIWYNNPQIENPHLIYPNDTIIVSYINGRPQISIGTRAYEKKSPAVREVKRDGAIAAFPAKIVEDFLMTNQVRLDSEMQAAPYVLGGVAERLYVGAEDEFYVHGKLSETFKNYGVFRQGDSYIDPDSGEILGHHVVQIGAAKVVGYEEELAMLKAIRAKTVIRRGDRLLEEVSKVSVENMYPKQPNQKVYGSIIAVENGRNTAGAMDIVALNRGYEEGIESGNLLGLFAQRERLKTIGNKSIIDSPERRVGSMLVISVYAKMSYGIILQASQQVTSGTIIKNL
jgi:hypothetical protein